MMQARKHEYEANQRAPNSALQVACPQPRIPAANTFFPSYNMMFLGVSLVASF